MFLSDCKLFEVSSNILIHLLEKHWPSLKKKGKEILAILCFDFTNIIKFLSSQAQFYFLRGNYYLLVCFLIVTLLKYFSSMMCYSNSFIPGKLAFAMKILGQKFFEPLIKELLGHLIPLSTISASFPFHPATSRVFFLQYYDKFFYILKQ